MREFVIMVGCGIIGIVVWAYIVFFIDRKPDVK